MGTNYYLHTKPDCASCGKSQGEVLHIGKSSWGWVFSLHVDPYTGLNTLDDWRKAWSEPGAFIRDEYGDDVPVDEMEKIITVRDHPRGLSRHPVDDYHCVGHGEGTWDYIKGEFS